MMVLVMYDIALDSKFGQRRLSRAAKICLKYGYRVQNSVYECELTSLQQAKLKDELLSIIDLSKDSLRFYKINEKSSYNEHYGVKPGLDINGVLMI